MEITATATPREWLTHCLNDGVHVWIRYGQTEVSGYVLEVAKHAATVQDSTTGNVIRIALSSITESEELA